MGYLGGYAQLRAWCPGLFASEPPPASSYIVDLNVLAHRLGGAAAGGRGPGTGRELCARAFKHALAFIANARGRPVQVVFVADCRARAIAAKGDEEAGRDAAKRRRVDMDRREELRRGLHPGAGERARARKGGDDARAASKQALPPPRGRPHPAGGGGGHDDDERAAARAPPPPLDFLSPLPVDWPATYVARVHVHLLFDLLRRYAVAMVLPPRATLIFDDGSGGDPVEVSTQPLAGDGTPDGAAALLAPAALNWVSRATPLPAAAHTHGEADLAIAHYIRYLDAHYPPGDMLVDSVDSDMATIVTCLVAQYYMVPVDATDGAQRPAADSDAFPVLARRPDGCFGGLPGVALTPAFHVYAIGAPLRPRGAPAPTPQYINLTGLLPWSLGAGRPPETTAFLLLLAGCDYVERYASLTQRALMDAWDATPRGARPDLPALSVDAVAAGWRPFSRWAAAHLAAVARSLPADPADRDQFLVGLYSWYLAGAWTFLYQSGRALPDVLATEETHGRRYRVWPWRRTPAGGATRDGAVVIPRGLRARLDPDGYPLAAPE